MGQNKGYFCYGIKGGVSYDVDWWAAEGCFGGAACVAGGLEGNGRIVHPLRGCLWR